MAQARLDFNSFSDRSRRVVSLAHHAAVLQKSAYLHSAHLLLGLVEESDSGLLKELGLTPEVISEAGREVMRDASHAPSQPGSPMPFSPFTKKIFQAAILEAESLPCTYVGTGHLLLGILAENESFAALILMAAGVHLEDLRQRVLESLKENKAQVGSKKLLHDWPINNQAFFRFYYNVVLKILISRYTKQDLMLMAFGAPFGMDYALWVAPHLKIKVQRSIQCLRYGNLLGIFSGLSLLGTYQWYKRADVPIYTIFKSEPNMGLFFFMCGAAFAGAHFLMVRDSYKQTLEFLRSIRDEASLTNRS